ncbi:MAG TPA: hypothetical protein GXX38_01275 [Clostridia bacterium]|nr:hypothetical protein [Clostridia bacterium]
MDGIENKLSDYIDQLNAEKKPDVHEDFSDSPELEELFAVVRMVRTLKEPTFPDEDYHRRLVRVVHKQIKEKGSAPKPKKRWVATLAAAAAVIMLAAMLNFNLLFNRNNIVHAMEEAYQEVKAYHGILEIVEINAEGKKTRQAQLEVWADKEGRYYLKEIEGLNPGLVTVNNGQKKWQVRPGERQVYIFPAFPDPHRFTFELGKEIREVKNALETKIIGEEVISGRKTSILEVSPAGGVPYRIWIDQGTNLPLQKQSGIQNGLQYRVAYKEIDFVDAVPVELIAYSLPTGFEEVDTNPEQLVTSLEEAGEIVGFTPKLITSVPAGYERDLLAVDTQQKIIKIYYVSQDKENKVVILQGKAVSKFEPGTRAVLGKINDNIAEIQSPIEGNLGILAGGGEYAGVTDIKSIRWQEGGFEYAVVGNASLEELVLFVKGFTDGEVQIPAEGGMQKPEIEVSVDLEIEENEQKSVDGGHSPWKLDPAYVAQVFVSLKIFPDGIQGEYPIKEGDLQIIQNTGKEAIVEISGDKTPIRRVYLKRLIRQDSTGIWTVVGYDPVDKQ